MTFAAKPAATDPDNGNCSVEWFAASRRLIAQKPDAHYGWLEDPAGPCIVKALDPTLTAYADTLLTHERAVLHRLQEMGAPIAPPVAEYMAAQPHWIVTRFSGLSLGALDTRGEAGLAAPTVRECFAAWIHLLRRLQGLAALGGVVIDLYAPNVLLPMTAGISGQLRLNEPLLVDHAFTVVPGLAMKRPVWLSHRMAHIAPELRSAIEQDQAALRRHFAQHGAALPGYSHLPEHEDALARFTWASYNADQALQQLIDDGSLSTDAAMQFAIGHELSRLLLRLPAQDVVSKSGLCSVVDRMREADPSRRMPSLVEAASALTECFGSLPHVSGVSLPHVFPADLAPRPEDVAKAQAQVAAADQAFVPTMMAQSELAGTTGAASSPLGDGFELVEPNALHALDETEARARRPLLVDLSLAACFGAVIGAVSWWMQWP